MFTNDNFIKKLRQALRQGEDLPPVTPCEIDAFLKKMESQDLPIGMSEEEAAKIVTRALGGNIKPVCFIEPSFLPAEELMAAREGKELSETTKEKMRKNQEAAIKQDEESKNKS
jgi:hypothetical protein